MLHNDHKLVRRQPSLPSGGKRKLPQQDSSVRSVASLHPMLQARPRVFKIAYRLNQFRLRRLCGEDFFLKFYDRRIATGSVVDILKSLRNIESGLNGTQASKYLSNIFIPPAQSALAFCLSVRGFTRCLIIEPFGARN
jgi:hypothetical protein